ncbi:MAG: hypothetical protein KBF05_08350 [Prevotella sp.]|nr:hypothetical protein [Prevotella sp.]
MQLWLTCNNEYRCVREKLGVTLHNIQRHSANHSNKLDDFALICRIFVEYSAALGITIQASSIAEAFFDMNKDYGNHAPWL